MPTMSEPISQQIRKLSSTTKQQTGSNHRFEGGLGGQEKMLRHSRRKEREAHGEDVCRSAAAERLASKSSKRKSRKTDS
ncbi:unnamed protein product [Sphagnum jensenii]